MKKKLYMPVCLIVFIAVLISYQTAYAHVDITVGDYEFEIGWVDEPPIAGQKNAILVHVRTPAEVKLSLWKRFQH